MGGAAFGKYPMLEETGLPNESSSQRLPPGPTVLALSSRLWAPSPGWTPTGPSCPAVPGTEPGLAATRAPRACPKDGLVGSRGADRCLCLPPSEIPEPFPGPFPRPLRGLS